MVKTNNLNEAIPTFERENISFNELLSMGEDSSFLRQYLIDLEITKSLSTRITFKINQILKNRDNDNDENAENKDQDIVQPQQIPQQSLVHIIISEEEDEAMIKLR